MKILIVLSFWKIISISLLSWIRIPKRPCAWKMWATEQSKNPLVQICLGDVKQKEDHDNVEMVVTHTHMFFSQKSFFVLIRNFLMWWGYLRPIREHFLKNFNDFFCSFGKLVIIIRNRVFKSNFLALFVLLLLL